MIPDNLKAVGDRGATEPRFNLAFVEYPRPEASPSTPPGSGLRPTKVVLHTAPPGLVGGLVSPFALLLSGLPTFLRGVAAGTR